MFGKSGKEHHRSLYGSSSRSKREGSRHLPLPDDVVVSSNKGAQEQTTRMRKFLESTKHFLQSQSHAANLHITLNEVRGQERRGGMARRASGSSNESGGGAGSLGRANGRRKSCLFNPNERKVLHPVTLTIDQISEYEHAFRKYDQNGDGVISVAELSFLLETIGLKPSEEEVVEMIATVDADRDGVLSMSEFVKLMSRHHNPAVTPQQQYEAIFKVFDADGNGYISRSEFKDTLFSIGQRCSEDELNALVDEIDVNRDGIISKKEFLRVFLNHPTVACLEKMDS
ncbi:hypothetical protein ACHWQZ_G008530 [Mnemiopsis leidyi]